MESFIIRIPIPGIYESRDYCINIDTGILTLEKIKMTRRMVFHDGGIIQFMVIKLSTAQLS